MDERLLDIPMGCGSPNKLDTCPDDPLESDDKNKSPDCDDINGPGGHLINHIVKTVRERLKNPFGFEENTFPTSDAQNITVHIEKQLTERKRRGSKESKEAQEFRLLRQRMLQMKNRLLTSLELPNKAEEAKKRSSMAMRLKRQKEREMETPEEAAARKKRHAAQVRLSRDRLLALETPEQTAARIARRNQKKKLRLQERQAKETPEERAARRERERIYRERLNEKYKKSAILAVKTGKIRVHKNKKKNISTDNSKTPEKEPVE